MCPKFHKKLRVKVRVSVSHGDELMFYQLVGRVMAYQGLDG